MLLMKHIKLLRLYAVYETYLEYSCPNNYQTFDTYNMIVAKLEHHEFEKLQGKTN